MVSGNANCRLRSMDSTFAKVCFLVEESVFHLSMRIFPRSACMLCAVCCKRVRIPFSSLTEAYATGGWGPPDGCAPAIAEASAAIAQKSGPRRIFREVDMGLRRFLLCFGNDILLEIDLASRVWGRHSLAIGHENHP